MGSKVGFSGRDSGCCRAHTPAGFLLPCSPRKCLSLPEQCRDFPGARMVHPVPQPPLRGHSASCQLGLCSAWAQGSRYKDTFLCHLLTDPLDIWNGEVPPLLCPGAEQQSGRCSLCRRALPRLCLWGRGTAVRCLRQSSRPTVAQPVPLLVQCPRKPQRNRVTPARPVRLGCCRRYSGHLPESPARPGEGSAAHGRDRKSVV